jgi:hypothetical protein
MKFVLTQNYTIEHKAMYDLTSVVNKEYAKNNGFEYISSDTRRCTDRNMWWEKIAWLIELLPTLEEGTMVVYQDCDSIGIGGDLKTALHDGCEYGMVQMRHGFGCTEAANWYNAGVIIMLNTSTVRDFLKRVWDRNDENDERSINKELKYTNYKIGNNKPICSLGTEWNCWDNNTHLTTEICIKSWHGITYDKKLKLVKEFIG